MKYSASILAFAASASAHMILNYPVPFGHPNNSPLDNSGSDFPCKATGSNSYSVTTMNEWNAGESKEISFTGSAVHGGGSCQFSLTTDTAPSKDSEWKVIHSVIGGCPATAEGNLPENAAGHGASNFSVTLPSDLPSGQYTFAWTWLNKLGNREFYMNCAPIKVSGSSKNKRDVKSVLGDLPDMFVANIPNEQCATTQGQDFEYPNPGKSVEKGPAAKPGHDLTGSGCASVTAKGKGAGSLGSPSQATGAPAGSSAAADQPAATSAAASAPAAASSAAASNGGGVFAPGASSAAPPAPAASTPAASAPAAAAPTGNSSSGNSVSCSTEGAVVCIGSDKFGICYQGSATPMALAAGTTCANGAVSKRSTKFPRAHLHRRHGSNVL